MSDTTNIPAEAAAADEMIALMQSRAGVYNLLARVFHSEVDGDFWHELRTMRYPQGSDNPAVNEAFRRVYRYVRHAREDALDDLAVDYARTFLGSGVLNPNAAFPYESVYTSNHALLMQEARDEVLAIYRSQGVDRATSWKDPEDHVALELEFLGTLCARCAAALAAGDDGAARAGVQTQYSFLTGHVMRWVPRFLADVPKYASADFYPAFAQLADAFLADDVALLEDIAQASGIDMEEDDCVA